ncbi:MAG TPA: tetratricopeptide repeat protein [Gemmatimonadaceae bacterium]|nr:tetratricopeptide repeat protein [Gemmatimonadaceae bacterium]
MINRLATLALFVVPLVIAQPVSGQTAALTGASKWADSASREIDAASDAGDLARLRAARTLLDRALTAFPNDALLLHYKGYELHREASLQEGLNHRDEIEPLLDEAITVLERSLELKPMPETQALISSIIGRQIAFHPWKAMVLGPRSGTAMTNAIALGPNNPRVWLLRGIGAMFTPAAFGGGLENSEAYLKKAEKLFATDHPSAPAPAWGSAEVYTWLGQIYQKQNKKADAIAAYNKALQINPDQHWVKFVLLPSAENR